MLDSDIEYILENKDTEIRLLKYGAKASDFMIEEKNEVIEVLIRKTQQLDFLLQQKNDELQAAYSELDYYRNRGV